MSSERTLDRTEIVNKISQVHLQPSQNLRQFSLSDSVYDLARNFVSRIATVEKYGKKHCRCYTVLNCIEGGGIYALLQQAAEHSTLEQVSVVIAQWQEALKALLRYALNLLLAPNRPELRTVKLYNPFFVYQITNKLKGAEKILLVLGYSPCHLPSSSTLSLNESKELVYNGKVDADHVAETATDLVILICDLEQLQAHVLDRKLLDLHQSPVRDVLAGVLKEWNFDSQNVLTNNVVPLASISQGTSETYDSRVSSPLPPNVQITNYYSRNLDYPNVPMWGEEDLAKDHVSSRSRDYEHGATNTQPILEPCQSSPKQHGSHWETPANIPTRGLSPFDDYLQHPVGNLIGTSADSLSSSFLQGIPRPNIDDLPEPIYNNEEEFSLGKGRFFGNNFDRQNAHDNNLIRRDFSLDEHVSANNWEGTNSSTEEATPITYSHEEIKSTSTRNDPSLSSHHGSLKRSNDPGRQADCQSRALLSSPPAAEAMHRLDSDLTKSYVILSVGHVEDDIVTDTLNKSNSIRLPSVVKSKQRTGDELDKPSLETPQTKDKCKERSIKNTVLCETEHTEDGFVVLDLCSKSNYCKCSETRTNGITHRDDKALERVEWRTGNTSQTSMWICHYCTNINAIELLKCEICGVKISN